MPKSQLWLNARRSSPARYQSIGMLRYCVTLGLILVALFVSVSGVYAAAPPARQSTRQRLAKLPLGMMVHPPSLDYFNKMARPDDIAGVPLPNARLLSEIVSGKRMVMSPSVDLAKEQAASFVSTAEYFGYNIEHWPDTPEAEKQAPVAASQAAAEFARQHDLGYILGPDLSFTEEFGPQLAQQVDIYVIQGQQLQENIPRFQKVVTDFAEAVRSTNPDVKVWVQVSASFGTPEQTVSALETVTDHIDGIWLHYNAFSFEALQSLVVLLRPDNRALSPTLTASAGATATAAGPTPVTEPPPPLPTATPSATPRSESPPTASPERAASADTQPTPEPEGLILHLPAQSASWLLTMGCMTLILGGGLIALGFILGYLWHGYRRSN